jgi:pyridinium-3,5-biscarboxylic acid mononucleotide sulfurtransferase
MIEDNKLTDLINILKNMESALLAYSGGADSTLLLKSMQLSDIRTLAVTAVSETTPQNDILDAAEITKELGIEHRTIKTEELKIEEFISNTPDRCFFCKDELFKKLVSIALSEGYRSVLDGSNADDIMDFRPGKRAALKYSVRSPLMEAGFSKKEIRELSRHLGLSTWDKPSSACLASRIPYGHRITAVALKRVEKAEDFLRSIGLSEVRVRDHGDVVRIEVREEEIRFMLDPEKRRTISETLKSLGYHFISLDIDGYQSGSMNRVLTGHHHLWKALDI